MADDADHPFNVKRAPPRPTLGDPTTADAPRAMWPRPSLLSSALVGSTNRRRVIEALFDHGPMSRADLARQAGVNRTTISGIVQPLLDQQLLVEGDPIPAKAGGGKPARPLRFSPDARPICGTLVMPGSVRSALVTLDGRILAEEEQTFPTDASEPGPIVEAITAAISRTVAPAHRAPLGIGVAVGGMVDTDLGTIVAVNLVPALNGLALGKELERRFSLPVLLDHHPRALLVGDRWFGNGRGIRDFAVVYTGEVLGGALYLDGRLQRGFAGAGGELGHTFVQVDGALCRCGRRGCWDTIATLSWLRAQARAADLPDPDRINSERLVALAAAGSSGAGALLEHYARNLAIGIANLQQTVAPNRFILHGDVVAGGETMIGAILKHVRDLVPWRPRGEITFETGETEDRAALLGAAGLILSHLLQFPL
jgi:predicted NBD/HSP70 family sugar kinase